jgi:hypothetical protein
MQFFLLQHDLRLRNLYPHDKQSTILHVNAPVDQQITTNDDWCIEFEHKHENLNKNVKIKVINSRYQDVGHSRGIAQIRHSQRSSLIPLLQVHLNGFTRLADFDERILCLSVAPFVFQKHRILQLNLLNSNSPPISPQFPPRPPSPLSPPQNWGGACAAPEGNLDARPPSFSRSPPGSIPRSPPLICAPPQSEPYGFWKPYGWVRGSHMVFKNHMAHSVPSIWVLRGSIWVSKNHV